MEECKMTKISIDKNKCIGCGACEGFNSNIFELGDEGFAQVKKDDFDSLTDEEKTDAEDAASSCPTNAIEIDE